AAQVRRHPRGDPRPALRHPRHHYYILRKRRLDLQHMYSTSPDGIYWFTRGWNTRALQAGGLAATFSIAAVWVPALADLGGYAWLIGAVLGGLFHWIAMRNHVIVT